MRSVGTDDQTVAELTVLAGYDNDLAAEVIRSSNRLQDALLHVHPALERQLGKRINRAGVLALLAATPTPQQLSALGQAGIKTAIAAPTLRHGEHPGQVASYGDHSGVYETCADRGGRS